VKRTIFVPPTRKTRNLVGTQRGPGLEPPPLRFPGATGIMACDCPRLSKVHRIGAKDSTLHSHCHGLLHSAGDQIDREVMEMNCILRDYVCASKQWIGDRLYDPGHLIEKALFDAHHNDTVDRPRGTRTQIFSYFIY
jgi:hypothetical protein